MPFSFASSEYFTVSQINCPEQLISGERSKISFNMMNIHNADLMIVDTRFLIDNSIINDKNGLEFTQNAITESFILNSLTEQKIESLIKFPTEGIHYIDLEIIFSDLESNSKQTIVKEICQVNTLPFEKETNPLILTSFISIIVSAFGGASAYFIKRHFINKDTEQAKSIDHQHWRLEQIHKLASKYYFPLAKDSWEVERTIALANQSGTNRDMQIAFDKLNGFLKRYSDFRSEIGATFLFVMQDYEQLAINKMQSILVSLPYDDKDIDTIVNYLNSEIPTAPQANEFNLVLQAFNRWVVSKHCRKSLNLILLRLREFGGILDKQAEIISHPNSIGQIDEKLTSKQDASPFWVLYSSSKYVRNSDILSVYGQGFKNSEIDYSFFLEGYELESVMIKDNFIELKIPSDVPIGTYDLSAAYKIKEKINLTIGIVVHIIK